MEKNENPIGCVCAGVLRRVLLFFNLMNVFYVLLVFVHGLQLIQAKRVEVLRENDNEFKG